MPALTPAVPRRRALLGESLIYLVSSVVTFGLLAVMMRLWRADWRAPFYSGGDATSSAAHFRTTIDAGWYEHTDKLGAPYGQFYHDFPFSDDLHPAMAKMIGLFTDQTGTAVNVYYVLGFVLAAFTATWFLRRCGLSPMMTVAMAALFALAPYHFSRNETHFFLASYYCIPLGLGVAIAAARGQSLWSRRAHRIPVVGLLTGTGAATFVILVLVTYSGAYYAVFTAILLAAAGIFGFLQTRSWKRIGGVIVGGGVIVATLIVSMLPDILWARTYGASPASFVRLPAETELYSFKLTSLIIPAPTHRIPAFAELSARYSSDYPLPGESASLGTMASIGFLILLLLVPTFALAARRAPSELTSDLRRLSFLTYVAFLTATIGGLGTLLSLFVTDAIRGWNRFSIFICLIALAALGLLLDRAARALHERIPGLRRQRVAVVTTTVAVAVLLVGAADQSVKQAVPDYAARSAEWSSSETFVQQVSAAVPDGAMLFQLPYMPYPESGPFNGLYGSDQLNLYLHTSDLRWSGGGMKGRPQTDWPAEVSAQDAQTMTRSLAIVGFQGIVVDRWGYEDAGVQIDTALQPIVGPASIVSPDGRYAFYSLAPVLRKVDGEITPVQRAAEAAQITHGATAN